MNLGSGYVRTALAIIRSNRARSVLTMLGIIVGVASVIVIIGISEGVRSRITTQVNAYTKNVITVTSRAGNISGLGVSLVPTVSTLTTRDVQAISRLPGVLYSVPLLVLSGAASADRTYSQGMVIATNQDLPNVLNQSMAYGSFFNNNDANVFSTVLGSQAAARLYKEPIPLGYNMNWDNQQFIVDGVLGSFNATPFSDNVLYNDAIFIPMAAAQQLHASGSLWEILVRAESPSRVSAVAHEIRQTLIADHGGQDNFALALPGQLSNSNNGIINLLTELTVGIAVMSLFLGGVGIMNVMLVSVAERMHEIGIRKAVGAGNRQIMSQFLIETITLSVLGGIIGVGLAMVIDLALRLLSNLNPVINWRIIVLSIAITLLIGITFGLVPAIRAARKQPIEALRND